MSCLAGVARGALQPLKNTPATGKVATAEQKDRYGRATAAGLKARQPLPRRAATSGQIDIFRRAYGVSDAAFAKVMDDLPDLAALRDIDTLRWGLEHAPDHLDKLVAHAKRALGRLRAALVL